MTQTTCAGPSRANSTRFPGTTSGERPSPVNAVGPEIPDSRHVDRSLPEADLGQREGLHTPGPRRLPGSSPSCRPRPTESFSPQPAEPSDVVVVLRPASAHLRGQERFKTFTVDPAARTEEDHAGDNDKRQGRRTRIRLQAEAEPIGRPGQARGRAGEGLRVGPSGQTLTPRRARTQD